MLNVPFLLERHRRRDFNIATQHSRVLVSYHHHHIVVHQTRHILLKSIEVTAESE